GWAGRSGGATAWSAGTKEESSMKYTISAGGVATAAAGRRVRKMQLLDVSRGNNVAIGLKALKRVGGAEDVASVVATLDPGDLLTTEDLQRLEACIPSVPEVQMAMAFNGPVEALGPAETFFRALGQTPRPLNKVRVMLFMKQFAASVEEASGRLKTLRLACKEVTESRRLAGVLERVLLIGNLLNEGTYKGNACGFRLDSLLKLSHTKSQADRRTTVLHFIVRSMAAKETRSPNTKEEGGGEGETFREVEGRGGAKGRGGVEAGAGSGTRARAEGATR
ncbi:unnamed protein product, partial [Discosporangium mesarthrocarpum]